MPLGRPRIPGTSRGWTGLPAGILGIVPFYGCLAGVYLVLCVLWAHRVRKYWTNTITLQLTLFVILVANWVYTLLAFAYYLHMDVDTNVTAEQVFGGIYAGFYRFREDPFAVVVASYRLVDSYRAKAFPD